MDPIIYDIAEIFDKLYGYKPAVIPALPAEPGAGDPFQVPAAAAQKRTTLMGSPIYGSQDMLGREVFCPIVITSNGKDYEFPFAVMGLQNKAIIIETPMVERQGSVIEEISVEAWKISIKGFLIDPLNQFPDEQLNMLNEVWKKREPVRLKCALSDLFLDKDDHVVITSLTIPEKAKVIGVRDFSFEIIQDGILDLYNVE